MGFPLTRFQQTGFPVTQFPLMRFSLTQFFLLCSATATFMINELVNNYEENKAIVDNLNIHFLPMANPDGYEYSRNSDRMWRKNRNRDNKASGGTHYWLKILSKHQKRIVVEMFGTLSTKNSLIRKLSHFHAIHLKIRIRNY